MLLGGRLRAVFGLGRSEAGIEPGTGGVTKTRAKRFAPNTKIEYKKNLIPILVSEHRKLVDLHGQIIAAAESNRSDRVRGLLTEFKDMLVGHLLKENTSLYTYLKYSVEDGSSVDLIIDMKNEMDQIGRVVMQFINSALRQGYSFDEAFISEFSEIGTALVRRIKNEERFLYSTYQQQIQG